ncbi:hypothetical protein M8J76_003878 [Diaphorina citri]|nr:hypothetical protein M8J75_015899 [Diaphorina citri]KAI5726505.1 hypothetical protein M8J76_003878 [Diaphorina citri]KAI5730990.1 hypothetical protein M8J77_002992 [Diaphorina citri]
MGCGGSTAVTPAPDHFKANGKMPPIPQSPVAFEVSLDDADSLVKKHPPKRLQRLEEQPTSPITHQTIVEKLAEAEARRLQILNQRILSAKQEAERVEAAKARKPLMSNEGQEEEMPSEGNEIPAE